MIYGLLSCLIYDWVTVMFHNAAVVSFSFQDTFQCHSKSVLLWISDEYNISVHKGLLSLLHSLRPHNSPKPCELYLDSILSSDPVPNVVKMSSFG